MNLGFSEMLFLSLLGLLLFGPKRLPEIGRQLGRAMSEIKRASSTFQLQIEEEVRSMEADAAQIATTLPAITESLVPDGAVNGFALPDVGSAAAQEAAHV